MISINQKYNNGKYQFPSKNLDPSKKKDKYCTANAEAIYSLFLRNKTAFSSESSENFNTLRLYANGQQPREIYKAWLKDDYKADGTASTYDQTALGRVSKRAGFENLNDSNVSPAPKIMAALHGMFDDVEWDIFVDTIDPYCKDLLEKQKYLQIVQGQNQGWQTQYKLNGGIPIDEEITYPKSREEFNLSNAADGFKLNIAKAMEKMIDHTFNVSKWDTVIKRKLVDDLAAIGYAATKDYYDPEDGFFKTKYIDIAKVVMQYSSESDYNNSEYGGYHTYITVSQLRQKMPDLTEDELSKIAKANATYYDNSVVGDWDNHFSLIDPVSNTYRYDEFKVPVFEAEWMDEDKGKRLVTTNAHGGKRYVKKEYDEEIRPLRKGQIKAGHTQQIKYVSKRVPYQSSWLIGTKHSFDNGPVQMAPRPQPSKPRLSFHVEQLMQPSYITQLRPMLDQIQIIWLRWQDSLAKVVDNGYSINMAMLQNITDGNKKMSLPDILKMFKTDGWLPFMQSMTGPYQGGDVTPIREIKGGLGTRLDETINALDIQFRLIENLVGFNPASLGVTPSEGEAVRNVQAAMSSTNNVLKPLMKAIAEVKTGVAETLIGRLQVALRSSKIIRDSYSGIVNNIDIELLQLASKDQVKYGLSMKPRPDAAFRAVLSEYVKAALQSGRDGNTGLEIPQAMLIDEQLYRGVNISEIRQSISYILDKNKKHAEQMQKENIQIQNDGLAKIEDGKQKATVQNNQMEVSGSIAEENAKAQNEMKKKMLEVNSEYLMLLTEQAGNVAEGVSNQDAKRRLSIALNIVGTQGLMNIDLFAAVGQAEGATMNTPTAPQTNDIPSDGTNIPPEEIVA